MESNDLSGNKKRKFRLSFKTNNIIIPAIILVAIILIIIGVYAIGYKVGDKSGYNRAKSETKTNVADLFNNTPNPFNTVSGKVDSVSSNSITIQTTKGEKQKVIVNDKTRISKGTTVLTIKDISKDTKVTVFTNGEKDNLAATRVLVRD